MLEPSSSEEEDEEYTPPTTLFPPAPPNGVAGGVRANTPSSVDGPRTQGAGSPSPSLTSEKTLTGEELAERQKKTEEDRKQRIQLYVFVLRCISYPFNAKQPNDMTKRHNKLSKEGLEKLRAKVEVELLHRLTECDFDFLVPRASSRARPRSRVTKPSRWPSSTSLRFSSSPSE